MSYQNLIAEVLSAHADQLLKEAKNGQDYAKLFPDQAELPLLLTLADRIKAVLKPVPPPESFKEQLQRDLLAAAYLKQAESKKSITHQVLPPSPKVTIALTMLITVLIGLFLKRWKQDRVDLVHSTS